MRQFIIYRIFAAIIRRVRHQFILLFARKNSLQSLKNRHGNNILIICYGNIYRSPLAEHLLNTFCSQSGINTRSAGFHENINRPCEPEYLNILKNYGYDLSNHRSKRLTVDDVYWSDVIIIMDRKNWDMLHDLYPMSGTKTVWIGAFSKAVGIEVADPYGKNSDMLNSVIFDIQTCMKDICSVLSLDTERLV
ncbi:MAG: low molecular weight phosphatase family protein [Candidatus Thiodiazotropha sp. (ex Cardiolucina cf. quadrata)]|nr:low molecular weight phosphatase family protein [Candidatus Thiodiazotropha sp. (ex Cardiolucina cf. quadrata)]